MFIISEIIFDESYRQTKLYNNKSVNRKTNRGRTLPETPKNYYFPSKNFLIKFMLYWLCLKSGIPIGESSGILFHFFILKTATKLFKLT